VETFFLLAREPVRNHQLQDCCLVVHVTALLGGDNHAHQHEVKNALQEQFGTVLTFDRIPRREAEEYLQSDPGRTSGSMNLRSGTLLWHLARIN
jgi:hypothetical protein